MQEIDLCTSIRTRIESVTASLLLQTDHGEDALKAPQVVNGYLPPKRSNDIPDFPYIIVRPSNGRTDNQSSSVCEVKILIGCFSEEYDGYEYAIQVMDRIRLSFMQSPTLDKKFRFEFPFDFTLFDDQPYPEWMLECTTRWTIATPQELPDEGVI